MKTFEVNKNYSNTVIQKNSEYIKIFGELVGGEHTITTEKNTFVLLVSGAWKGGKALYYKCVK